MHRRLVLVLLILGLLTGPRLSPARGEAAKPNIVVIVIDTLRADRLPFYGCLENTAPFLSSLASRGTLYENVYSVSSWTAPATASLFTSLYPVQHGVLSGLLATRRMQEFDPTIMLNRLPAAVETIPEILRAAGPGGPECVSQAGE